MLIPPSAGVFSSFGLLYADVEYHFTRTRKRLLRGRRPGRIAGDRRCARSRGRGRGSPRTASPPERIEIRRSASLHYQGQSFELRVPLAAGRLDRAALAALEEAFGVEHERTYGHRAGAEEPVELVTLEVVGRGIPDTPRAAPPPRPRCRQRGRSPSRCAAPISAQPMAGSTPCRQPQRSCGAAPGPCIVEEYDSTCLVPPGWTATLDRYGNILIDVPPTARL